MLRYGKWKWALLLSGGFAFGQGPSTEMKVDEPQLKKEIPEINLELQSERFSRLDLQKDLTPEQQKALEERKQKTRELALLIKEKRKAIREADPNKKEKLALEFQKMLLDRQLPNEVSGKVIHESNTNELDKRVEKKINPSLNHFDTQRENKLMEWQRLELDQKEKHLEQKETEKIKERLLQENNSWNKKQTPPIENKSNDLNSGKNPLVTP